MYYEGSATAFYQCKLKNFVVCILKLDCNMACQIHRGMSVQELVVFIDQKCRDKLESNNF